MIAEGTMAGDSSRVVWQKAKIGASSRRLAAMAGRPALGIVEESSYPGEVVARQAAKLLGGGQHVPPGGEPVQGHAELGQRGHALREDAVVEDHQGMLNAALALPDRLDEVDLAAAIGRQILDQQHALAGRHRALDLVAAAEALGLLADIEHRQLEPL